MTGHEQITESPVVNQLDGKSSNNYMQFVPRKKLLSVLQAIGYPKPIDIKRGVEQGCLLSPSLFNVFSLVLYEVYQKRGNFICDDMSTGTEDTVWLLNVPSSRSRQ